MNSTYTVNHKKVAVRLCHNIGKSRSIFKIFALKQKKFKHVIYENTVTTADYWPSLWWSPPLQRLIVQEQGAEKKVMNRTARAWYKRYAYIAQN